MWVRVGQNTLLNIDPDDLRSIRWDVASLQVTVEFKNDPSGKEWHFDDANQEIIKALFALVGVAA